MNRSMTLRPRSMYHELMRDPFDAMFRSFAPMRTAPRMTMKTDIAETESEYKLAIDLPGFSKENLKASLKDGYLVVEAQAASEEEKQDGDGDFVFRERIGGSCKRAYYVGDGIVEDAISAKFEDGVLTMVLPKKTPALEEENKHEIAIA